jgi:hypothetical protein
MPVKPLSEQKWLVELNDSLPTLSSSDEDKIIQIIVVFTTSGFSFQPWRVLRPTQEEDGTLSYVSFPLPDTPLVWEVLVPMAQMEFFHLWVAPNRQLYRFEEVWDEKDTGLKVTDILSLLTPGGGGNPSDPA